MAKTKEVLEVVAGGILVLAAIIGLYQACSPSDENEHTADPTTPSSPPPQSGTMQTNAQTPPAAAQEKHGDVTLTDGDQIDLEENQVGKDVPNNDLSFAGTFPQHLIPSTGAITDIYSGATAKKCQEELDGESYSSTQIGGGRSFCLRTVEGHMALVQVVKESQYGNGPVQLKYTVWL